MRGPLPSPAKTVLQNVLVSPKTVDMNPSSILLEAATTGGCSCSHRRQNPLWVLRFAVADGTLHASLLYGQTFAPIVSMEHHLGRSAAFDGSVIPPGYHWDVFPPIFPGRSKVRIGIDNDLHDSYDALLFFCAILRVQLDQETQPRLRL